MTALRERLLIRRLQQRDERAFVGGGAPLPGQGVQPGLPHDRQPRGGRGRGAGGLRHRLQVHRQLPRRRPSSRRGSTGSPPTTARTASSTSARRAQRATAELDEAAERETPGRSRAWRRHVDGPDEVLEGLQMERIVQAGIARLDEEHRLLIVLRDVEELSYEEICAITGLPEGTVKSRLHRARMALKELHGANRSWANYTSGDPRREPRRRRAASSSAPTGTRSSPRRRERAARGAPRSVRGLPGGYAHLREGARRAMLRCLDRRGRAAASSWRPSSGGCTKRLARSGSSTCGGDRAY